MELFNKSPRKTDAQFEQDTLKAYKRSGHNMLLLFMIGADNVVRPRKDNDQPQRQTTTLNNIISAMSGNTSDRSIIVEMIRKLFPGATVNDQSKVKLPKELKVDADVHKTLAGYKNKASVSFANTAMLAEIGIKAGEAKPFDLDRWETGIVKRARKEGVNIIDLLQHLKEKDAAMQKWDKPVADNVVPKLTSAV